MILIQYKRSKVQGSRLIKTNPPAFFNYFALNYFANGFMGTEHIGVGRWEELTNDNQG